jgi:hypothetical protein
MDDFYAFLICDDNIRNVMKDKTMVFRKTFLNNHMTQSMLNTKMLGVTSLFAFFVLAISFSSFAYAQDHDDAHNYVTSITPIDATTGLEKTIITFTVPEDNTYPWGYIEGKIKNHVPNHPVIIQIYDNDDLDVTGNNIGAVHFTQTNVDGDGSYDYRFRISDNQDGNVVNFFEGQYTVKIFSVVYLGDDNSDFNTV